MTMQIPINVVDKSSFQFVLFIVLLRNLFCGAGFRPAEWIKGTLTIQTKVYMKKTIASIKT